MDNVNQYKNYRKVIKSTLFFIEIDTYHWIVGSWFLLSILEVNPGINMHI